MRNNIMSVKVFAQNSEVRLCFDWDEYMMAKERQLDARFVSMEDLINSWLSVKKWSIVDPAAHKERFKDLIKTAKRKKEDYIICQDKKNNYFLVLINQRLGQIIYTIDKSGPNGYLRPGIEYDALMYIDLIKIYINRNGFKYSVDNMQLLTTKQLPPSKYLH